MSVHVSSWVWKHSKAESTELLVLLALADQANDEGNCYPSIKTVAERCRLKKRTVQENIRAAEKRGELIIFDQQGPHGTNVFQFTSFGAPMRHDAPVRQPHPCATESLGDAPERVEPLAPRRTQTVIREPSEETTKRGGVVVALSSAASEEDSPDDIVEKLTTEFGLGRDQSREVDRYLNEKGGVGYVLEKAHLARSEPRKNIGGWFMRALAGNWKAPVSTAKPKKAKPVPPAEEPQLSFEERQERLAATKAAIISTV